MSSNPTPPRSVKAISSVFHLRRDLAALIKKTALAGSGLTLNQADLLVDLYGASKLGWEDPTADSDGYVSFSALKESLGHGAATLSRRLDELKSGGFVEVRPLVESDDRTLGIDKKRKAARITPEGEKIASQFWEKYLRLCEDLLKDFPLSDQTQMWKMNEAIMKRIRWQH